MGTRVSAGWVSGNRIATRAAARREPSGKAKIRCQLPANRNNQADRGADRDDDEPSSQGHDLGHPPAAIEVANDGDHAMIRGAALASPGRSGRPADASKLPAIRQANATRHEPRSAEQHHRRPKRSERPWRTDPAQSRAGERSRPAAAGSRPPQREIRRIWGRAGNMTSTDSAVVCASSGDHGHEFRTRHGPPADWSQSVA